MTNQQRNALTALLQSFVILLAFTFLFHVIKHFFEDKEKYSKAVSLFKKCENKISTLTFLLSVLSKVYKKKQVVCAHKYSLLNKY
ncbi:hypothetical protein Fsol_00454 [Candidatus Fokinia solitaria]|uniref:Uncharacterized protein n=1 Tax=Candidatus Fokinia solitaria TaxID=1802984 RepID=A0A2U8BSC8_9RICK|nr:hypothetical protein Fsol_00454 [Candidatus Fokinia solitaria]